MAQVRFISLLVLSLLAWCVAPPRASAQNVQHTKNSVGLGLRSPFKVNPATNALELSIPLGPTIYPQRGGGSVAPTLDYSSKIWRMAYAGATYSGGPPPNHLTATLVQASFAEGSRMGWTFGLGEPWVDNPSNEVYDAWGNPVSQCVSGGEPVSSCCFIDRIRIHMPDGSTHEFRSSDRPYCYGTDDTTALPDDLYSVDGTSMRYQRSLKRLYLPDGSYWNLANGTTPAQYFDRNGNRLMSDGEDSLGRTFTSPLANTTATDYTYTVPGVDGTPQTYTLRWRNLDQVLTVPQALPNYSDDCVASGCTAPFLFTSDTGASTPIRVVGGSSHLNPLVLHQIVLPHDSADQNPPTYTFTYNTYLEIDKVVYPTGGYERFKHGLVEPQQQGTFVYAEGNRGVTDRWVSARGDGTDEVHWQYAWVDGQGQLRRGEINPEGTRTERVNYGTTVGMTFWSYSDARAGRTAEVRVYNAAGQMARRSVMEWANTGSNYTPTGAFNAGTATRNPRLVKEIDIILDTGSSSSALVKTTLHNYDTTYEFTVGPIETSVTEYDYVTIEQDAAKALPLSVSSIPTGTALRTRETVNVLNDSAIQQAARDAYRARNLVSLPSVVRMRAGDAAGAVLSETGLTYDEYDSAHYPLFTYGTVKNWLDPQTNYRGNATTTRSLISSGVYAETHARYDQCGNVRHSWDANNKRSQVDYADSFSDGVVRNTYAYPTTTTSAVPDGTGLQGSNTGLSLKLKYDFSTGLVRYNTDANDQTTALDYTDPLNRLKSVTRPTGGGSTTYDYGDSPDDLYVRTRVAIDDSRWTDAYQYFDGLGRPSRAYFHDSSAADRTWVAVKTAYDDLGRTAGNSNPQFRTDREDFTPTGVTTTEYDYAGRVKKVLTPDGSFAFTSYDAYLTTSLNGNRVTVTDQADKVRTSVSDSLGRLVMVTEAPGVVGYGYETSYEYDLLGNMTKVIQGKAGQTRQTRAFTYDRLSRLKTADNPESGTAAYEYDPAGHLTKKVDARHVQTEYTYDALNRVIKRTHSMEPGHTAPSSYVATPEAKYYYDGTGMPFENGAQLPTPQFSAGRLTATKTSVSETIYTEFDRVGRVTRNRQVSDPGTAAERKFLMEYGYNLAGGLTSEKYPSGKVFTSEYDDAGRLSGVKNQATGSYYAGGSATDISGRIRYAAHGAVEAMRLGNGLWEYTTFNARLQAAQIGLGVSAADPAKLSITYGYGPAGHNNGNVRTQRIQADGLDLTQTYNYDEVNRLLAARETPTVGGTDVWRQAYTYLDSAGQNGQFGNRRVDTSTDPATGQPRTTANATPQHNPQVSPANNRFADNQNYAYDTAGSLVQDPSHAYAYDGEGRIAEADGGWNGATGVSFYYDGDGRRVKKVSASEATVFVYDASGRVVAEYSNRSDNNGTSYLTQDDLGSTRIVTGQNQSVKSRHDYFPFGEEVGAGVGGRTTNQGYSNFDGVRRGFTGYEKDAESGLNYAQARYHSPAQGRFTSVDPLLASAVADDPQSWNRYVYCLNNPLSYTDSTGRIWVKNSGGTRVWFSDERWKNEIQGATDADGNALYTPLTQDEMEYNSVEGRVRLNPNGPDPTAERGTDAYRGWSIIGDNTTDYSAALAGGIVLGSRGRNPWLILGGATIGTLWILSNHEIGHIPAVDPLIYNSSSNPTPSVPDSPTDSPGAGWEWRGKPGSQPGDPNGQWHNPTTGESMRWDKGRPSHGPHWDYISPTGGRYRIYPDGTMEPKTKNEP